MRREREREITLLVKIYRSNPSFQGQNCRFQEVGQVEEGKNPRGRKNNERMFGQENWAVVYKEKLGAKIYGSEVGATDLGSDLRVKICGAEMC